MYLIKLVNVKKRQYNRAKCFEIEEVNTSDPTAFWDCIKGLGPKRKSKIPWECYAENGDIISDTDSVLRKWKDDFLSLYTVDSQASEEQSAFRDQIIQENRQSELSEPQGDDLILNIPFTEDEIMKSINGSKNNKAPGMDSIVYDVLKNNTTAGLLTRLFNRCFETRRIPDAWLQALIYPIPKSASNDPRIPLNYRGISLLSVISKLYTATLNRRLNTFTEENELIVNEQNGFRRDRSCLDHIFVLQNSLRIRNELNTQTFCAFIDFKKAFDLVDREFLLYKLRQIGVNGNFYHAIKSLYSNTRSCVQVNDKLTDWFDVKTGVRQGDSLSPTLFSIFLNDLAEEIKSLDAGIMVGGLILSILLYADDIVLIAPTPEKLQAMLDVVTSWCRKWGMDINAKKTQILHVRNHQRPRSNFEFRCGENALSYTESYKYLGFFIHEHLSNSHHAETLTGAASRSFGRIQNMFKSLGNMGIRTYETLYGAYVKPIMNYASGVWGYGNFSKPQVLMNRISRFYLGVHRFAPLAATKIEMDWLECRETRWLEMLRLFNRINTMEDDRLPNIIMKWDISLKLNTWYSEIQHIAAYLGLNDTPANGEHYDLTDAYNGLLQKNRNTWQLEAQRKPKLRTFMKIHDFSQTQALVQSKLSRYQRSLLAQIKMGILPLKLETQRYQGLPPEKRLCTLCNMQTPEDELHFLFNCPSLETVRADVCNPLTTDLGTRTPDDIEKFQTLISGNNLEAAGLFIEKLYRERQRQTYH